MFEDEAGFGRINKPKRCWCQKGLRPSVPCHKVREYSYAYAAVSPHDEEMVSLVLPYSNTACMNVFLQEVSKRYPNDAILMLADNAAWHRSKGLDIPNHIEILPLHNLNSCYLIIISILIQYQMFTLVNKIPGPANWSE